MKNPLDSITGTIISGLVLTVILYLFVRQFFLFYARLNSKITLLEKNHGIRTDC